MRGIWKVFKEEWKDILRFLLIYWMYMFPINFIWVVIDKIEFGSAQPSISDSIFGIALVLLLTYETERCIKKRKIIDKR